MGRTAALRVSLRKLKEGRAGHHWARSGRVPTRQKKHPILYSKNTNHMQAQRGLQNNG